MHSPQNSMPSNHSDTPSNYKENTLESPKAILDAIAAYTDKRKKPKRNRSAFILFSIDKRNQITDKDLESLNPNDKFVKIAELWKGLTKEEKKMYEDKAKQEKRRYHDELNDFCKIFPAEPIQRPRNHIKKPCNAYGYYLKEIKDDIRKEFPKLRMCEVLRVVGERWKNLEPEKKIYFEKKAEKDRENFKIQTNKQSQVFMKSTSNKSKEVSVKDEDDHEIKSPKTDKLVKLNESTASEAKSVKSVERNHDEGLPSYKNVVCSLSPVVEKENVRESFNKSTVILQNSLPMGELPTRKSSFSSISNSYNNANSTFGNFAASPLPDNSANTNAKFLSLLDMYLKVDLLRQNIFMQMQSLSATSNQPLSIGNFIADQINNLGSGQLDHNSLELLSKNNIKISPENEKVKKEDK